jgi:hypothetical protein
MIGRINSARISRNAACSGLQDWLSVAGGLHQDDWEEQSSGRLNFDLLARSTNICPKAEKRKVLGLWSL